MPRHHGSPTPGARHRPAPGQRRWRAGSDTPRQARSLGWFIGTLTRTARWVRTCATGAPTSSGTGYDKARVAVGTNLESTGCRPGAVVYLSLIHISEPTR